MIKAYKFNDSDRVFLYDDLYLSDTFVDRVLNSSDPITVDPANPYGAFLTTEQYENLVLKLITEVKSLNEKPTPQINTKDHHQCCGKCKEPANNTVLKPEAPKATKPTTSKKVSKSISSDVTYDKETNSFKYTRKVLNEDGSVTTSVSNLTYDELPDSIKVLLMNPHFRF